jgi:hypothetical protein
MTSSVRVVATPPHRPPRIRTRVLAALILSLGAAVGAPVAEAQLITIKTLPIADGDQFNFFPSANAGMANPSIALADSLFDPFVNPAKAARVRRGFAYGSPSMYSVTYGAGGGQTLPLGGIMRFGSTFAGLGFAVQSVERARRPQSFLAPGVLQAAEARPIDFDFDPNARPPAQTNRYAFGTVGRVWEGARLSIAASAEWAGLEAVDGVDLLYSGSQAVVQDGGAFDARVGLLKELSGDRSLELVLLHNRFGMTHDVGYLDVVWDPGARQILQEPRFEHNVDRTRTWGAHVAYVRPLADSGWRIGYALTANRLSHPKIPTYEIQQVQSIPRDPGNSSAYNLGVGISKVHNATVFALDAVYEPIWSHTWAEAETQLAGPSGGTIEAGAMTIENHFQFWNAAVRTGLSHEFQLDPTGNRLRLQGGVALRSIQYHLHQRDHVQATERKLNEGWLEWTPTWGAALGLRDMEIRYVGWSSRGTGRPGVRRESPIFAVAAADASGRSILSPPSGPITLDAVHVTTHQLSFSIPIR